MESHEKYLQDLKQWLHDTSDSPLEEMSDFFTKRLEGYEEHMSIWEKSYQMFSEVLPSDCRNILDLGCGTGLELDKIWEKNPDMEVTGVDLCQSMLDKLQKKHSDKRLTVVSRIISNTILDAQSGTQSFLLKVCIIFCRNAKRNCTEMPITV